MSAVCPSASTRRLGELGGIGMDAWGQRRLDVDLFCGDGVVEFQELGVQEVSSIAGEAGEVFERQAGWAVERIAYEGMADGGQVDSDLVGAARMEAYLKCCGAGGARDHLCQ